MNKVLSLIRRAPKRFSAVVLMLAAAIIVPAVLQAWGPDRPTFTERNPAPYVTFNSITDNPRVGDERNFVRIRETGNGEYINQVNFEPGKVYDVSVYYHNNAATRLNASGEGIARNTTLKMEVPNVVTAGVNAALTGTISASNAKPGSVWDEAYGKNATNADIALRYVAGSASFVSNGAINGQTLPDSLFTTGAKLGFDGQDGNVPGCNEFSGFVNFKIRVDQPNFNVIKKVSTDNGKTWTDDAKAKPGSTVKYAISYQNTGTNQQDNVSVRDMLPKGVTYVNGSTYITNQTTGGQPKKASDGITTVGYNAGSYQPKGNVLFTFDATLPKVDALECGTNKLVNTARVTTNAGYKEDTANVTVDRECKPTPKYFCTALTIKQLSRTEYRFATGILVTSGADYKGVTYTVRDASGTVVNTKTVTGNNNEYVYTQTKAGAYSVQATVLVTVNGQDRTATSDACKGSFTVPNLPKEITVCELATKKIVTIKESEFNSSKYSKNLDDCKDKPSPEKMKVCVIATKQIETINKSDFDASKYTTDFSKCEETPVVPPELPHTGAGENIVAVVGLGAMIASAAYYIASRRALNQ